MKLFISISLVLISFTAQAEQSLEPVGISHCNGVKVDDSYNRYDYLTNSQGQVKIDLSMEDNVNSDNGGRSDEFRTEVIQSLTVHGPEIIHQPTGVVCAEFKKSNPLGLGRKFWYSKSACKIKTVEKTSDTFDKDGFPTGKTCQRSYFFTVKVK